MKTVRKLVASLAFLAIAAIVVIALALPAQSARADALPAAFRADKVVVIKSERRLLLVRSGAVIGAYRIALGHEPVGPKAREGDGRTPEGSYRLDWRNARSRFYKSIHISYPSRADRARARRDGVSPGGDIMIHGLPNGYAIIGSVHAGWDWTEGCIAVTNREIDQIWSAVADGTPIEIRP